MIQLGIQSLTLEGGGTIEDLELDFTLTGYPDIELKVYHLMCVHYVHVIHSLLA